MITLKGINKSYGNLHVLRDVDLTVGRGEIVAILGPSGAGKTTLLNIAGSLELPDSGTVEYDGESLTRMKPKALDRFRCRNMGFIFQFHELLPEFTALENVALPALIAVRKRKEAYAEAKQLLDMLGLGQRLDHKPGQLSGGEKQRAAIARALINSPRLVLADEPTGSLDSRNRDEILGIIQRLCAERGQTFLIVTHDPMLASIAHRIVKMKDGRIEEIVEGRGTRDKGREQGRGTRDEDRGEGRGTRDEKEKV